MPQETKIKYERKLIDLEQILKQVEGERDRLHTSLSTIKAERSV